MLWYLGCIEEDVTICGESKTCIRYMEDLHSFMHRQYIPFLFFDTSHGFAGHLPV